MRNKTILVTGATGFLGRQLLHYLRARKYRVCAFSEHGNVAEGVDAVNLLDKPVLKEYIHTKKPDVVYHVGAVVDLSRDYETAKRCIYANIFGTTHLLDALQESGIKRFVFTSTEEVYGASPIPFREDGHVDPPSPYAVTKLSGEYLSKIYGSICRFSVVVLRIGTMYGPEQIESRFIPSIITRALDNQEIKLTTGVKKRDYIFVFDVLRAMESVIDTSFKDQVATINLGGGVSVRLIDMVEKIVKICRSSSRVVVGAIPERVLEADEWLMDISMAKKFLDWEPKVSLIDGLKQTVAWYHSRKERLSL